MTLLAPTSGIQQCFQHYRFSNIAEYTKFTLDISSRNRMTHSYLKASKQCIAIEDNSSEWCYITTGVTQGGMVSLYCLLFSLIPSRIPFLLSATQMQMSNVSTLKQAAAALV